MLSPMTMGQTNWRGVLQEYAVKKCIPMPVYVLSRGSGEDHCPVWFCSLTLGNYPSVKESSSAKKKAEQLAAEAMCKHVRAAAQRTEIPISHESSNLCHGANSEELPVVVIIAEVTSHPRLREIRANYRVRFCGFVNAQKMQKEDIGDLQLAVSTEIHVVRNKFIMINSMFFYLGKFSTAPKLILLSHTFVTSPELTKTVQSLFPEIILTQDPPHEYLSTY